VDLSLLVTIVAVIGLLGTAAAVVGGSFRVSRNTQVVANYRDAAQAWEAKATAQETEMGELRSNLAAREKEIIELTSRVSILQDMVTGKNAVEQILPEIRSVRDELLTAIRQVRNG
jgi:hypothetical protein